MNKHERLNRLKNLSDNEIDYSDIAETNSDFGKVQN